MRSRPAQPDPRWPFMYSLLDELCRAVAALNITCPASLKHFTALQEYYYYDNNNGTTPGLGAHVRQRLGIPAPQDCSCPAPIGWTGGATTKPAVWLRSLCGETSKSVTSIPRSHVCAVGFVDVVCFEPWSRSCLCLLYLCTYVSRSDVGGTSILGRDVSSLVVCPNCLTMGKVLRGFGSLVTVMCQA